MPRLLTVSFSHRATPASPRAGPVCLRQSRPSWRVVCRAEYPFVAVIGAGAAGLTAAYFAAKEGAKVTVIEKTTEAGKKILISGGTRCNVLPSNVDLERDYFTESSSSALRAIFSTWDIPSCKDWLEHDIKLQLAFESKTQKYFPHSNSGKEVRDCLVTACCRLGVSFKYQAGLARLEWKGHQWICTCAGGERLTADHVVMASGGKSFPNLGTDGAGLQLLEAMGHSLHKPYPALAPLKGPHISNAQLAGVSLYEAQVNCIQKKAGKASRRQKQLKAAAQRSAMLFTHRGTQDYTLDELKCTEIN